MSKEMLIWAAVVTACLAVGALLYGSYQKQRDTGKLRRRLRETVRPPVTLAYDTGELAGLPPPVERYFRQALTSGQPIIQVLEVRHQGTFNMSEKGERWAPFTSTQLVVTNRPGFDWAGRIRLAPGIAVDVHDAYVEGEGLLRATWLGLITFADYKNTPELARGELMRFLAEAAWYPTALLPSQGVRWEEVDESTALARLRDGATELAMTFRFGADGLIESVRVEDRGRLVAGKPAPTPWEGRWMDYERRQGMLIPTRGEVAWLLPEGRKPYWRGRVTKLVYELAG